MRLTKYKAWTELFDNRTGGEAKRKTLFKMSDSNSEILFEFKVFDDNIFAYGESINDKLYNGDIVEILLSKNKKDEYYEIEVNPDGLKYMAYITHSPQGINIEYLDLPIRVEHARTDYGWHANIAIDKQDLESLGVSKDSYFAIYRQDKEKEELMLYALFPTFSGSFHKPEYFQRFPVE